MTDVERETFRPQDHVRVGLLGSPKHFEVVPCETKLCEDDRIRRFRLVGFTFTKSGTIAFKKHMHCCAPSIEMEIEESLMVAAAGRNTINRTKRIIHAQVRRSKGIQITSLIRNKYQSSPNIRIAFCEKRLVADENFRIRKKIESIHRKTAVLGTLAIRTRSAKNQESKSRRKNEKQFRARTNSQGTNNKNNAGA